MSKSEQQENLFRVQETIGPLVLAYCKLIYDSPHRTFSANDLRHYVMTASKFPVAPSSPDRILRLLRKAGQLDYECINRRGSTYRVVSVG